MKVEPITGKEVQSVKWVPPYSIRDVSEELTLQQQAETEIAIWRESWK